MIFYFVLLYFFVLITFVLLCSALLTIVHPFCSSSLLSISSSSLFFFPLHLIYTSHLFISHLLSTLLHSLLTFFLTSPYPLPTSPLNLSSTSPPPLSSHPSTQDIDSVDDGIERQLFSLLNNTIDIPSKYTTNTQESSSIIDKDFEWDFFVAHFLG
jgi:hypothetical protein